MGRPLGESGGCAGEAGVPSPEAGRCVGRIVVGPSGSGVRAGAGRGGALRLRTPRGASLGGGAGAVGAAGAGAASAEGGGGVLGAGRGGDGAATSGRAGGAGGAGGGGGAGAVGAAGSCVSRRSPSASARRRMRSAWASSMDAEGLDTPMPSFCASASSSLLDMPSSLESSWTRIFFNDNTFPYAACAKRTNTYSSTTAS